MEIIRGKLNRPKKVVIYGPEGIGKTTMASQFPTPLFCDTEGSTANYDVARLPAPSSYEMLKSEVDFVIRERPCATFVLDTMDWAEKLIVKSICDSAGKSGIEDFGYGKGYTYASEEVGRLLNQLDRVIDAGMNVVVTAHAAMRKVEQPDEMGSYDHWELKLSKQSTQLVKEWADILLFCNYKTYVVKADEKDKKGKAQGGRRVMYTSHHPCWDAKNRFGLPAELDMSYQSIREIIEGSSSPSNQAPPIVPPAPHVMPPAVHTTPAPTPPAQPNPPVPSVEPPVTEHSTAPTATNGRWTAEALKGLGIPTALADLMAESRIDPEEIQYVVAQKGYFPKDMPIRDYPPDFIDGVLVGAWSQVHDYVIDNRPLPF